MSLVNAALANYSIAGSLKSETSLLSFERSKKRKHQSLNVDLSCKTLILSGNKDVGVKNSMLESQLPLSSKIQLLDLGLKERKKISKQDKFRGSNLKRNLLLGNEDLSKNLLQNAQLSSTLSTNFQLQNRNLSSHCLTAPTTNSVLLNSSSMNNEINSAQHKNFKISKTIIKNEDLPTLPNVDKIYSEIKENITIKPFHDDLSDLEFPPSINDQPNNVDKKVDKIKVEFIDAVCSSLLNQPRYTDENDKTRIRLQELTSQLCKIDPEFVLKVALYCRQDLNVRSTSNFLICVASTILECRAFLKKYYSASVQLPTDWMIIAEYYQKINNDRSLPTALRKVMVEKFLEFDQYQLAKYNKDKAKTAKKKFKIKQAKKIKDKMQPSDNEENEIEEDMETYQELVELNPPTLKSLIRQLHITKPALHVMSIIGKKYPASMDEFYACGLEGTWDCKLAGTRMKLPVPTTWETQLSARGNNAKTWQDLLDKKAVPYMAMLRNIRNMIKVGISEKHHNSILKLICNEKSVERGRQFPFRYFSAYQILDELENELDKQEKYKTHGIKQFLSEDLAKVFSVKPKFGTEKSQGWKKIDGIRRQLFNKYNESFKYDKVILERYRKSLNSAVEVATRCNVNPIKGKTLIMCDVSSSMSTVCDSAKGLGSSHSLSEVGILLGLMCSYSCESSTFVIYTSSDTYQIVEIEKGGILTNLKSVFELSKLLHEDANENKMLPTNYLDKYLFDAKRIDNFVLLSRGLQNENQSYMDSFLNRFRDQVFGNLKFYEVNLSGKRCSMTSTSPLNIRVSGYSDQILRYIAEGGGAAQLSYINNIDKIKGLKMANVEVVLPPVAPLPPKPKPSKIVRVFISSTVKDMHSERDALVQLVFPEVRRMSKDLGVEVYECDLRWGVHGENSRQNVKICLDQVKRCHIFIGIIGERYGWVPSKHQLPHDKCYDWIKGNAKGISVTEMEIMQGAILNRNSSKSFFYMRDSAALQMSIPKDHYKNFFDLNKKKQLKLKNLKKKLEKSNLNIKQYNCSYGGMSNGKPVVTGLNQFCYDVIEDLMTAIFSISQEESDTNNTPVTYLQEAVSSQWQDQVLNASKLVGLQYFLPKIEKNILEEEEKRIIVVHGTQGCGKTTTMSYLAHKIDSQRKNGHFVLSYTVRPSSSDNSTAVKLMLLTFLQALNLDANRNKNFSLNHDLTFLSNEFWSQVEQMKTSKFRTKKLFIFIDGVDMLSNDDYAQNMQWIRTELPSHVTMVLSCMSGSQSLKILQRRKEFNSHPIPLLNPRDRALVIKRMLSDHSKILNESHFNNQLQKLLMKRSSNIPLYLNIACHYIRLFCDYESLSQDISEISPDLNGLIDQWFCKVETVMPPKLGKMSVAVLLGVLHCSDYGISEQNLHDVLAMCFGQCGDNEFYHLFHLLSLFVSEIKTDDGIKLSFSNSIYTEAVEKRYLTKENGSFKKFCHKLMACYYIKLFKETDQLQYYNAINQLPYHLTHSGDCESLMRMLSNFLFVDLKCQSGNVTALLNDFINLKTAMTANSQKLNKKSSALLKVCEDIQDLIACNISLLTTHPHMLYQLCINRDPNTHPYKVINQQLRNQEKGNDLYLMECVTRDNTQQLYTSLNLTANAVAISPNGKIVACGLDNGSVVIYAAKTCKKVQEINVETPTSVLKFVSKKFLLCGHRNGFLHLVNSIDGTIISKDRPHRRFVSDIAVRDKLVVTCSHDRALKTWNFTLKPPKLSEGSFIPCDRVIPNCVDVHPTQQKVVAGLWDGTIRVWDVSSKKRVAVIRGSKASVTSVKFSICERYIFSCSLYGDGIRVWSAESGSLVGVYGTSGSCTTMIDSMATYIVAGGGVGVKSGVLSVWGGRMGKLEANIEMDDREAGGVSCCAFHSNHKLLAAGCRGNHLALISMDTHRVVYENRIHTSSIRCLCWYYDTDLFKKSQDYILCGHEDSNLTLFSLSTKKVAAICHGHSGAIVNISSSSSELIATASEDFTIVVWSLKNLPADPTAILTLYGHEEVPLCLAFNKKLELASGGKDMKLIYHKNLSSKERSNDDSTIIHNAHSDWITSCSWHNKSKHLVTGSNDGHVKIWLNNVAQTISSNTGAITGVCFRNGCILVSGSNGFIEMWSHTGVQITSLDTGSRVNSCALAITMETKEDKNVDVTNLDWSEQVDLDQWSANHEKNLPGSKRPDLKAMMNQFKMVNVATTHDSGVVKLWRPLVGDELAVLPCNSSVLQQVAHGNGCVVTNSISGNTFLWDLQNLPKNNGKKLGHDSEITCLEVLKHCIISSDIDGFVKIWRNKLPDMELITSAKAHSKKVSNILVLNESSNNATFITAGFDLVVNYWDFTYADNSHTLSKLMDVQSPSTALLKNSKNSFFIGNTDGLILTVTLDGKTVKSVQPKYYTKIVHYRFDWPNSKEPTLLVSDKSHLEPVTKLRVLSGLQKSDRTRHSGSVACTLSDDEFIWSVGGHSVIMLGDNKGYLHIPDRSVRTKIHDGRITAVLTYMGLIITCSYDRSIKLWNIYTLKQVGQYFGTSPFTKAQLSNNHVICTDLNGTIHVFRLHEFNPEKMLLNINLASSVVDY